MTREILKTDSGYVLAISEHAHADTGIVQFRMTVYMPPAKPGDLAGGRVDEVESIELKADGSGFCTPDWLRARQQQ